jgi:plasmid stabilization system protein ParE
MKIVWSKTAEKTYLNIIEQTLDKFTAKEAEDFMNDVDLILVSLQQFPEMFEQSKKLKCRKCVVNKNFSFIYRHTKTKIEVITFLYNRSNHAF